jgi:two-component system, NtrC family, response regulator AtoC
MRVVRQKAEKVIGALVPILIHGGNGTGKEVLARWIHEHSPCRKGDFVKVNCAAIPGPLLESELFGYERGAFSGAFAAKPGRIEMARQGTLFFDEVSELELSLQAKLLHLLQDGRFSRIADGEERNLEARVMFSTNRDLLTEVAAGTFRMDLFYRMNVIQIDMPALRERREDIPGLVQDFISRFAVRFERVPPPISPEAMRYLQEREWRGNIRELENCVARYVLLGSEDAFWTDRADPLAQATPAKAIVNEVLPLKRASKQVVREMERDLILAALRENRWNRRRAAEVLNISYRALMYKISGLNLARKSPRTPAEQRPDAKPNPLAPTE